MKQPATALRLLKPLGLLVFLLSALGARAQQRAVPSLFREDAAARQAAVVSPLAAALQSSRPLTLDAPSMQAALAAAPLEGLANATPVLLALPLPDGTSGRFRVVESPVMEPGLAVQFPNIKTYSGVGLDDPTASVRLDLTPRGFHAQILSDVSGTVYIDPVTRTDTQHYLSFARSAMPAAQLNCGVSANTRRNLGNGPQTAQRTSGPTLRTYRLAVAATGEYTTFQGGTVALAQAAIVTTVNRVRGVYEKELAVSFTLVGNNSLLVYTNSATDPYTNADPDALLDENQTNVDAVIGSGNYDIGHVFSTAGGGLAGLGVVCRATQKAQGETGTSSPAGDAFDIDYVAHEMGHQCGANHTFNGTGGSCSGNRNTGTAYEPGSGTTIMAYAGICGAANNTQNNSNAYFHVASYEEIQAYLATTSCGTSTATGNTPPTVTLPASSKVLPISTPFKLTAVGSDANGDALTYCWEEYDLGSSGSPTATQAPNDNVPLFRSFSPSSSPTRYFPQLSYIIAGTAPPLGERLPTVTRSLNFRVTLRDHYTTNNTGTGAVGGVNSSTVVALSSVSTAGPFIVTAPNTAVTWAGNSSQTVTWDVANTSAAPVSCATVNIRLSTDGGLTYPTLLLAGTPNDGSVAITVPSTATTTARIMVEAADNYFFDISGVNFTITAATACAAPTGLSVGSITATTASVSFTASGSATSYVVTTTPATTTQTVTASPVSLTGLLGGTGYTVNIVSNCAAGATSAAATASFTTTAPPVCNAVTNVAVGSITATTASVSFTASAGASNYVVTTSPATTTQTVMASPVSLTGLTAGTAYTVNILTNCSNGGTAIASATFGTPPANDECGGAINLVSGTSCTPTTGTVTGATQSQAPSTCSGAASATANDVWYSFVASGTAHTVTVTSPTFDGVLQVFNGACGSLSSRSCVDLSGAGTETLSLTGLTMNTRYYIRFYPYSTVPADGSFTICVTGSVVPVCAAPTNLSTSNVTSSSASLSFTANALGTSYTVTTSPATTTQTVTASPVSLTGLTAGTAYTVNITTACTNGVTSAAATTSFSTSTACAAPTGLAANSITSSSATVSFTASGSATNYTVTTTPATTTQTVAGSPVSFTGLAASTAYTVNIVSNCAGGATAGPATVSFTTNAPAPTITSLTPNSGPIGTGVAIAGTNLTGATAVSFNGTAASFTVNSATSITATVPTGASTGNVTVTTGGGTSNGLTFTVTTPAANTTTTLTSSLNPSAFGQSVTLTATVSSGSGSGTPGGTVTFFDGATSLGNGTLNAGGIATLNTSTLAVGSHSLTVVYNGATGFNGSTSAALTQVVNLAAATTMLASSPNPSTFGQTVALTATVSNANGTPTGSVSYYDGSTLLGNATLSSGVATLNVIILTVGSHSLTAIYSGSSSFATSTSAAITQVVNAAAPTITSLSPTSGLVGSSVIITGTNLTGATAVSFNGTAATVFTANSATSITVTVPAGATTGNVTVTTGGGTSNGVTFTITTPTTTSWLGGGSANWFTASNWSAGVPTSTLDATVPAGASPYPIIASGTAVAKSLTIGSSASLTQSGGTLVVPGNIANSGTISATAGLVSLSGTASQAIGGSGSTQFWSLAISNPAGASQTGAVSIHGVLALSSGNLTTNGQLLTLLSDATGTALVDNTGGVVNGTATVQRYIDPSLNAGPGYRHYSAPVTVTTVADFGTGGFTPTVNSAYNTSATPGLVTPFPTVFGYDESRVLSSPATTYSAFDKGWVSPGGLTDALQVGRGYTVNIAATQKVDFVGSLNNGPVSRSLGRSSADGGLHLVGNPYPSPLDWSRVSIPAGLDNAMYVFQSTSQYGGSYRSYVNGVGNPLVALGQGFFVRMSTGATTATLTMTNAARETTPSATTFNRGSETRPLVQLKLRGNSAILADEAYVYFENGATAGIDAGYDARKIQHNTGGAPTIFALAAGTELSINGLPHLAATTVVQLGVAMPQAGAYTFEATQLLNLSAANVYLHDALTGQDIDLRLQPTYTFSVPSAALLTGRFSLTFEQARVLASAQGLSAASVSVYPNPTTGNFTILMPAVAGATQVEATLFNSLGQQVGQHLAALPAAGTQLLFDAKGLASGIYMLRVKAGDALVTKRVTIK